MTFTQLKNSRKTTNEMFDCFLKIYLNLMPAAYFRKVKVLYGEPAVM